MVLFRPVFIAAMIQCLALVLVCLLFAPGARAVPQYHMPSFEVLDAAPDPASGKGSGLGSGFGGEAKVNGAVDAAVSSSSLYSAPATTASASAAPSQASSSTNGALGVSVPAAFLFSAAASSLFLVF